MTTTRSQFVLCLVLSIGGMAVAQTVTPPVAEFRGLKAEGSFRIDNNTDQPMSVVLEVRDFKVNEFGKVILTPLSSTVHLELGSSSFIVGPHDNHIVFYKASSSVSPASFSILPMMTPMSQTKGVRFNLCVPHNIYLYQKAKLAKSDVQVSIKDNKVTIANTSVKLGRVQFIHAGSQDLNGFPIYPGQTREVSVVGDKATVQFENFKVEVR